MARSLSGSGPRGKRVALPEPLTRSEQFADAVGSLLSCALD